jgi:hypothetical protein
MHRIVYKMISPATETAGYIAPGVVSVVAIATVLLFVMVVGVVVVVVVVVVARQPCASPI